MTVSGPHRWREGIHGRIEVVGLASDNDHVEWRLDVFGHHVGRRRQLQVAEGALNHQSGVRDLCRAQRSQKKRHVAPRLQQAAAEITTECAGTHHQKSHCESLLSRMTRAMMPAIARACFACLKTGGEAKSFSRKGLGRFA